MKVCKGCNTEKDFSEFYKRSNRSCGIANKCKSCCTIYNKMRYARDKEKVAEYHKNYLKENREKVIKARKRYYAENKDSILERDQIYYQNNKEKIKRNAKKYRQDNPDKVAAFTNIKRARKLNQMPENANLEKIAAIYKEARRLTEETGIQRHVDHIKPLSKGGLHHEDNLQILTAEENLRKGARYEIF